jgi:hypothetical protein
MKTSSLCFQAAVLFVLVGMGWGIQMAASHDHSAMPAHAHLNLLGWVSLFLFGVYYHLHPSIDASRLAAVQAWTWIVGTTVMVIGIAMIHAGKEAGEPLAAGGALVLVAAMLVFGWMVLRSQRSTRVNLTAPASAAG